MKALTVAVGLIVPLLFGFWRYQTTSETHPLFDAVGWGILSVPFSFGLWLSVSSLGKRLRYLTLLLILLGAPLHLMFSDRLHFLFTPLVGIVEIYAAFTVIRRRDEPLPVAET